MTHTETTERQEALEQDRVLADWLEAEAIVARLRRAAAAAEALAADRARAAAQLARSGRRDAWALGVADAAEVLAHRAEVERRRLEEAQREELRLRARCSLERRAVRSACSAGVRRCG